MKSEFVSATEVFSPKNRPIRYQLFSEVANEAGGVVWMKYLRKKILVISDPLIAKELYTKHAPCLIRSGISNGLMKSVIGSSVLTVDGDEWLHLRQDINPSLNDASIDAYIPAIVEIYASHFDKWLERSASDPVSIYPKDILHGSYFVKSKLIFGESFSEEEVIMLADNDTACLSLLAKIAPSGLNIPSWIPFSVSNSLKKLNGISARMLIKYLDCYLDRSSNGKVSHCILDSVYNERLARGRCPLQFGQQKQIDLIKTLFYSATATTSMTILWALRILSSKPQVLEIIKNEIDSLFIDSCSLLEVFPLMHSTRAFVLEVLRIYPSVPSVLKEASCDISSSIGVIPKGSAVIVSLHGIHMNPLYWADPTEFRLERFELNASHHETFWTFGGLGSHACPGKTLALSEVIIVLALIVRRFSVVFQPSIDLSGNCNSVLLGPTDNQAILLEPRL